MIENFFEVFFVFLSAIGHPFFWFVFSAVLFWQGKEKESFFLMSLIVFSGILVGALKTYFKVPRPITSRLDFFPNFFSFDEYSFPSGHATTIAGIYGFYREKMSKVTEFFFLAIIAGVAYSRVFLGKHFPIDVAFGLILGFVVGKIFWIGFEKFFNSKKSWESYEELGLVLTGFLLVVLLFLFEDFFAAAIFLGYFLGLFLFKFMGFDTITLTGKRLVKKMFLGLLGLFLILVPFLIFKDSLGVFVWLFFFSGFWVTFVFPVAYEKALKNKTTTK